VAAQPGDSVELFGVGFGPTTPTVPAGKPFSGSATINTAFTLYVNRVRVQPSFVGLSSAGLYQINFVVPYGLGAGNVPIQATVGVWKPNRACCFRFNLDQAHTRY